MATTFYSCLHARRPALLILSFLMCLAALLLAPRPAGAADLTYEYRYQVWYSGGSGQPQSWEVAHMAEHRFRVEFPYASNCAMVLRAGTTCRLNWLGKENPIQVDSVGPHSFQFISLPGHTEGAGRHINFSFLQTPQGGFLDVYGWGPWTAGAYATVVSGSARDLWQYYANQVYLDVVHGWSWLDVDSGSADCSQGYVCLYQNVNANRGQGGAVISISSHANFNAQVSTPWEDFRMIACLPGDCRNGLHGNDGTFNDQMSSWVNASGRRFCWYFDIYHSGESHPTEPYGASQFINLLPRENDQASSIHPC